MQPYRVALAVTGLGLASVICFAFAAKSRGNISNSLVCDSPKHDFGTFVAKGADLQHTFVLKNLSSRNIRILKMETTCGCTAAQASLVDVPANAETFVNVTAHWWNRSGQRSEQIKVTTDAPGQVPLVLAISGNALRSMAASTTDLDFGRLSPGLATPREVLLYPGAEGTIPELRIASVGSPLVKVERASFANESTAVANSAVKYLVSVEAPRQAGVLDTYVFLSAVDSPRNAVAVRIHAQFIGAIVPSTPSLFFGPSDANKTRSLVLKLPHTDAPLEIAIEPPEAQRIFRKAVQLSTEPDLATAEVRVDYLPEATNQHAKAAYLRVVKGSDVIRVPLVIGLAMESK